MADRYAYIPLIGIFVMIAFGVADWAEERRPGLLAHHSGCAGICGFWHWPLIARSITGKAITICGRILSPSRKIISWPKIISAER